MRAAGYLQRYPRTEVDASIRGVMLSTEYLEEYEDWEDGEEDGTGEQQRELI